MAYFYEGVQRTWNVRDVLNNFCGVICVLELDPYWMLIFNPLLQLQGWLEYFTEKIADWQHRINCTLRRYDFNWIADRRKVFNFIAKNWKSRHKWDNEGRQTITVISRFNTSHVLGRANLLAGIKTKCILIRCQRRQPAKFVLWYITTLWV